MPLITPTRTSASPTPTQPTARLLTPAAEPVRVCAVRETLGKPADPPDVGQPRAFVPVPHRSMTPGHSTIGLQPTGKPASILRGAAWSTRTVRPHCSAPLGRSDI